MSTKHQEDGDPGLKSFILLLKQYDQSGLSFVEMPASNYKTKTLAKSAIFHAETMKSIGFRYVEMPPSNNKTKTIATMLYFTRK